MSENIDYLVGGLIVGGLVLKPLTEIAYILATDCIAAAKYRNQVRKHKRKQNHE